MSTTKEEMIDLDSIIDKYAGGNVLSERTRIGVRTMLREAMRQIIELAAEKAQCVDEGDVGIVHDGESHWQPYWVVDKQSILDTLKCIKP